MMINHILKYIKMYKWIIYDIKSLFKCSESNFYDKLQSSSVGYLYPTAFHKQWYQYTFIMCNYKLLEISNASKSDQLHQWRGISLKCSLTSFTLDDECMATLSNIFLASKIHISSQYLSTIKQLKSIGNS